MEARRTKRGVSTVETNRGVGVREPRQHGTESGCGDLHLRSRPSRRVGLVIVALAVGMCVDLIVVGCANPSEPTETDTPVAEAPRRSEERPVWAEGPVDNSPRESESGADAAGPESSQGRKAPSAEPKPEELFPNERVTLDFRRAKIRRILRIFQAKARQNIVIDDAVQGRITVQIDEAPIADAFRAVLVAAELGYETAGGDVVVRPE